MTQTQNKHIRFLESNIGSLLRLHYINKDTEEEKVTTFNTKEKRAVLILKSIIEKHDIVCLEDARSEGYPNIATYCKFEHQGIITIHDLNVELRSIVEDKTLFSYFYTEPIPLLKTIQFKARGIKKPKRLVIKKDLDVVCQGLDVLEAVRVYNDIK